MQRQDEPGSEAGGKTRNPNIEIRNKSECQKFKCSKRSRLTGILEHRPFFGHSDFEFVSDFDIRISCLGFWAQVCYLAKVLPNRLFVMNVKVLGILLLLTTLCIFMVVMTAEPWYRVTDSTFLKPNNIENLLRRTSLYGILGIGVAFVIISSGIDLSIGSIVCLSGCLLAVFLRVDYRAFDENTVVSVDASDREFVIRGAIDGYAVGDRIRFAGGRRARSGVFTVSNVTVDERALLGKTVPVTVLSVSESISRDDRNGQIARAHSIVEFSAVDTGVASAGGGAASITLSGQHSGLSRNDQIALVHPTAGLSQQVVEETVVSGGNTIVILSNELSTGFSTEWLAIPLERRQRLSVPVAVIGVLGIALALGLVHGLLITRVRLQPFVVTLCGLLVYRGVSRWLVSDQPVGFGNEYEHTLSHLGSGKLTILEWESDGRLASFGLPYPFFILVMTAILAAIFLNKTIWGRYLLALGRNEEAARYSGINTRRIKMAAYVISTSLAALGGILFALDSNSISPSSFGNFFELYAIAAAVLGGCSLRGGEGSIFGVLIGTAVMQVLYNLIVLMRISGTLEFAIIGIVILFGVIVDECVKRLTQRKGLKIS